MREHQRSVRNSRAGEEKVVPSRGTGLQRGILFHLTWLPLMCLTLPTSAAAQGVCDRTPQVADALVRVTRASTCGEVTATHLSGVRNLRILTAGIIELQADDFSGLDSLEELFLDDNRLSTLPEKIFNGLGNLEILSLRHNPLTSLPAGLFKGLDNLQDLAMIPNHLTSLPTGIFSGLSSLQQLRVGSELTSLPTGIFSGLSSLQSLWLFGTMSSLPAGIFSGLSSLQSLGIDQALTSLPSGVFSGLSSLEYLNLTGNRMTSLPAEIFSGLHALQFLFLNDNSLTLLPSSLFGRLGSLQHLEVNDNSLNSLPSGIFSGLNSLDGLYLEDNELESLPSGVFGDLTKLRFLSLEDNELESLPAGIFDGLTSLIGLNLGFNAIPLLPAGIFDDVLDTLGGSYTVDGYTAQGRLTLEYRLLQAELAFTSTAQRLPQGSDVRVEATLSRALPVGLRVPYTLGGTAETGDYADLSPAPADGLVFAAGETYKEITLTLAGVVDNVGRNLVMTLGNYSEIKLRRSDGTGPDAPYLSSRLFAEYPSSGEGRTHTVTIATRGSPPAEGICKRTPQVGDALVKAIGVVSDCTEVTRTDLAGVTSLGIAGAGITELHADDFSGLSSLRELNLASNQLTRLPEGIFSGLGTLERLTLNFNPLESLSQHLFSGLGSLKELNLVQISNPHGTAIAPLPEGVFQELSSLKNLDMSSNRLTALPERIFAGLSSLEKLDLNFNSLESLPEEVFKGLGSLRTLEMTANSLNQVPEKIFSGLNSLEELHLNQNSLTGLPEGVFNGLGSLQFLSLRNNQLNSLTEGIFEGLGALENLYLAYNSLTNLPVGIFNGLNSLTLLELFGNRNLTRLPIGIFDDVLDTLGSSLSSDERLPLQLDSVLAGTPAFTSTAQRVSAGSPVRLEVTLSRSLPVALRIPYTLDGTATEDDYADLAPDPLEGLLFPAGETSRAISFTLTAGEDIESVGRTLVLKLSNPSGIKLRRSDGSGPDAPHLSAEPVIAYRDEKASHTLTISPEGTGPAEGICDRTPHVRDALVEAVAEVSTCGQVIAADLAKVTSLSLEWSGIVSLKANDFSGLSSLNSLRLHGNSLTALPEGLFEELVNLQTLTLDHNSLTGLPMGVFSGLARLQELSLTENPLGSLSEDTFKGLSQLQRLFLGGISLGSLPERLFNGLSRLEDVFLGDNALTRLPEKAFSELGSLQRLFLHNNKLQALPEAVFNGLNSLQVLDLYVNSLSALPDGIFNGLGSLESLKLHNNRLNSLPGDLFDKLDSLVELTLGDNNLTRLPTGIFDEILDTLGSIRGILHLDPDLRAPLDFALSEQSAAAGSRVTVEVTLKRALPVAVRVPYTLGGTATGDDYSDLSPIPEEGLLFLAGETTKVITLTLAEGEGSEGRILELALAELSDVRLRRSEGTGPDVPYLAPTFLIFPDEGAVHSVAIAGRVSGPEDPADFTAEDLTGMRLTLDDTSPPGTREAIRVTFREANRFEVILTTSQGAVVTEAVRNGVEAEAAATRFGSYDYQPRGPQTGSLTLDYDDGESCTIELAFDFVDSGNFNSACSGGSSADGNFQLRAGASFVPVILTAAGRNNSFFSSELTLTNRGSRQATLNYTYTPKAGGGGGTASDVLGAGRQTIARDAMGYLRSLGIPIPKTGNRIGTLRVEVAGSSGVGVTVRTTTAVADGRAGLAYPGVPEQGGFTEAVFLCGLRQNGQDRSNVAFQNVGTEGAITVRTTVYSGDAEDLEPRELEDVTLEPGGFHQHSGLLGVLESAKGNRQGYVQVERIEGTAPFYAYGVINDQANSDGSFVFPVTRSSLEGAAGQILPVIVETSEFSSELTVTNFSQTERTLHFSFEADNIQTSDHTAGFTLIPMRLEAGEQRILPDIVEALRRRGVAGLGSTRGFYAGPLFVTAEGGDMSGIVIGARTGSEGEVGQYSVFYNAVPGEAAFSEAAWVDGLQQDEENRSNLALVNTGEADDGESIFSLEIYDGDTGMLVNTVTTGPIPAKSWNQVNGILGNYAQGTRQGYIRIRKISGNNPFLAYGVVNDGGAPGERSGDGAYVPARK